MNYSIAMQFRGPMGVKTGCYIFATATFQMLRDCSVKLAEAHAGESVSISVQYKDETIFSLPNVFRADDMNIAFDLIKRA